MNEHVKAWKPPKVDHRNAICPKCKKTKSIATNLVNRELHYCFECACFWNDNFPEKYTTRKEIAEKWEF